MQRTILKRSRTISRLLWRRVREWMGFGAQPPRRDPVYRAPVDMTGDAPIRALIRWGENALDQGHKLLVLDLTDAADMDSGLIAGIILLSRRIYQANATLKLVGYSEQFEMLMKIYKLWGPLARTGVILEPYEKSTRRVTWSEEMRQIESQSDAAAAQATAQREAAQQQQHQQQAASESHQLPDAPPRPATG